MKNSISRFHFLFCMMIGTCPAWGQACLISGSEGPQQEKKIYTKELDSLWSENTYLKEMSPNGEWVAFSEVYSNKENWLTLKNISNDTTYMLKNCNAIEFSQDSKWFGGLSEKELILVDLVNCTKQVFSNIVPRSFYFSKSGDYITAYQKSGDKRTTLLMVNLNTKEVTTIPRVSEYQWHPTDNRVLMIKEHRGSKKVLFYNAENHKSIVVTESQNNDYSHLKWSGSGNAIFIKKQNDRYSLHYIGSKGKVKVLDDENVASLGMGYQISGREAYISEDGKKVLFYREAIKKKSKTKDPAVEIWNSDDPWIYPRMQYYKETELRYLLTAWYPAINELVAIETEQTPTAALHIDHDYALVFNQLDYEPQYKFCPYADLYIKNIKTGKPQLITEKQYTDGEFITISPEGKYISYFKSNDWWVYDIEKDKTVNLTQNLSVNFQDVEKELPGEQYPYGNPGWLNEETYIILYDRFDIWLMTPDGKQKKRITRGREEDIKYRVSKDITRNNFFKLTINQNFASAPFNTKNGLLLDVFDNDKYKTGYAILNKNYSVKPVILEGLKLDNVLGNKERSIIVYRKQKFNRPIGIYSLNLKTKKENLKYQSNRELMDYDLGKAELIEYKSPTGELLKGSLIYPANYDPDKKYPMIVQIYEKESKNILKFTPPSDEGIEGLNLLKYTTNGYFVFYPDFSFTIGDPGISALKSLTAGVTKVLETGKVDKERIGLIGHSFGGYETAFIVTQTNMFAAAVAGAAVTDLVNYYHNVFWDFQMNQLWRIESQQFRMGTSFYNNKEGYYRNSPLQHIENVNTPLLLWTGKLDTNINWNQSVNMFMGLKRLNKTTKMLLFEKEPHNLRQRENQRIRSREIFDWMETYVKKNN